MANVSDIISEIQDFFGSISDAQALNMIQKRDDYLRTLVTFNPSTVTLSSLVDGTREYALAGTVARIFSARYIRSAATGDSSILHPTSRDELYESEGDWEGRDTGEPRMFYVRGGEIGFYPTPDATSSGGYPKVDLEVQSYVALTTSTAMPTNIPTGAYDAWTFHVCEEWGMMKNDPRIEYFRLRKEEGYKLLRSATMGRVAHYNPKLHKGFSKGAGARTL